MQDEMTKRKLASVQVIETVNPIPGADRIEIATMIGLGWQCVIKKGEAKPGDKIVYFECDSILPEKPEFEFLREVKFRVKIRKFKKQIAEGLIMPLSILPVGQEYSQGTDVTEILSITKHDPEAKEENEMAAAMRRESPTIRFLMGFSPFRYVYLKLNSKIKGNWPDWIVQTDETRIQTCAKRLMEHFDEEWYISEKLDGQSATFFTYHRKTWGFWNKKFGVCSRKIWLKTPGSNNYWNVAQKFDIGKKLLNRHATTVVQGEILAPGVQANKYKMTDKEIFIFNIFEDGKMLSLEDMEYVCQELGLRIVPILNRSFIPSKVFGGGKEVSEIVRGMIEMSQGDSELLKRKREGIVVRLKSNPNISFKVINPYFSIEEE